MIRFACFFRNVVSVLLSLSATLIACEAPERPVTKEEALDFAKKLEISIGKRDGDFMNSAMDTKILIKRANLPDNQTTAGIGRSLKMGASITTSLTAEGTYAFIKEYEKNDTAHLLFRMYDGDRLNYHDIELIHSGGQCKIADIYVYTLGENFSETLHDFYLQVAGDLDNKSDYDQTKDWMDKIPKIRDFIKNSESRKALDVYNTIPDKYKSGKVLQILHIGICSGLSTEEYGEALDEYRKFFPEEPNTALLMIDGYVLHKQYDKALEAVNKLDSQINKDPFLDYYRYLCYNLLDEKDKSLESIERVVKNEPDFGKGVLELITTYIERQDYKKAKPLIEKYQSRREWQQSALTLLLAEHPEINSSTDMK